MAAVAAAAELASRAAADELRRAKGSLAAVLPVHDQLLVSRHDDMRRC
jgi:hypothetical protein